MPAVIFILLTVLPVQMSLGGLHMTALRFYLAIMFFPALAILLRKRDSAWPIDVLLGLTALWSTISILKVAPQSGLERAGSVALDLLGGYLIARAFITDAQKFIATFRIVLICIASIVPFALIESLTGATPLLEGLAQIPFLSTPDALDLPSRMGLDRAQVVFAHPIHYGLFCSTAGALLLIGCRPYHMAWRVAGLAIIVTGCVLSLSSGAVLSLGLQLVLVAWAVVFGKLHHRWALLIGLSLLGYFAVSLVADRSPYRVFLSHATFSAHNAYWRELILEWGFYNLGLHPVFGVGSNDWIRPGFMKTSSMDNFWLYLAVKYGIPALIFMALAWIGGLVAVALAPLTDDRTRDLRLAWIICFIGLTFTLATVHVWTTIYSYVFFLFGAGLWILPARDISLSKSKRGVLSRNLAPRLARSSDLKQSAM